MQKGQSSSLAQFAPSKRLSEGGEKKKVKRHILRHSGQLGIKPQNLELSLYHSCLHLFTNAYIYKRDLLKTTSSKVR